MTKFLFQRLLEMYLFNENPPPFFEKLLLDSPFQISQKSDFPLFEREGHTVERSWQLRLMNLFVVVLGEYSYYDKKKGFTTTHGPLYVHFAEKCLKGVDKENFYGKDESFPYEKIILHPASKAVMPEHEIQWLSSIGVKVWDIWERWLEIFGSGVTLNDNESKYIYHQYLVLLFSYRNMSTSYRLFFFLRACKVSKPNSLRFLV